jgi:N-acetylmuramoyl-L-alanine amidase
VPPGVGMRDIAWKRRTLLRLLAGCGVVWVGVNVVQAQPDRRQPPRPGAGRAKPQRRYLPMVVIDPGHGGIDPGAIGVDGVYEKHITFPTAVDLAHELRATGRFRVALTRGADEYVPLRERVARARALHADLFLSIHANALPDAAMRGLSVFTLSTTASDRDAAAVAASENREITPDVHFSWRPREVEAVLIDLVRRETDNLSLKLAHDVVVALGPEVKLLANPQRSAGFIVLTAPDVPSALVELGCLSNPTEERLLQQPAYRRRLARGLAHAVEAYFAKHAGP